MSVLVLKALATLAAIGVIAGSTTTAETVPGGNATTVAILTPSTAASPVLQNDETTVDPYDSTGVVYSQPFFVDQHFDYEAVSRAPSNLPSGRTDSSSGSSPGSGSSGSTATTTSSPSAESLSWAWNYPVYEGPTASGASVLVVTKSGGALSLAAVNASDGVAKWTVAASLSAIPPAVLAPPVASSGIALALTPRTKDFGGYGVGIEGVNVATGKVAWSESGAFAVFDPPKLCPGPGGTSAFCLVLRSTPSGPLTLVALRASSGKLLERIGGISRYLGPSLYENAKQPLSLVDLNLPSGIGWVKTISSEFGSTLYNPDFGWRVAQFGSTIIATFGRVTNGTKQDLSNSLTVGIAAKSGKLLWRVVGSFECGGASVVDGPYMCEEHGTVSLSSNSPPRLVGGAAVISGINVRTGAVTWRYPVGDIYAFVTGTGVAVASADSVVVPGSNGDARTLNLESGRTSTASGEIFWCPVFVTFSDPTDPSATARRAAPNRYEACNAKRKETVAPVQSYPATGIEVGDHEVWIGAHGLEAVQATGT